MKTRNATIVNGYGIHVRPSSLIVKAMSEFGGTKIWLDKGDGPMEASGVMDLMVLELSKGTAVVVKAEGPMEQEACDKMVEMLETDFDFDR